MNQFLCLCLIALCISPIFGDEGPELIATVPVGPLGKGINYIPRRGGGGGREEPAIKYVNEKEKIIACLDADKMIVSVFDLETGQFLRSFDFPKVNYDDLGGFALNQGIVYVALRLPMKSIDDIGTLSIFNENGEKLGKDTDLIGSAFVPVWIDRDRVVTKTREGQLISFEVGPTGLEIKPVLPPLKPVYKTINNRTNNGFQNILKALDLYNRFFHSGRISYYVYDNEGQYVEEKTVFTPTSTTKKPFGYGMYPKEYVAPSGLVYYLLVSRSGLEVYRYITPDFRGQAFMRLYHEDKMLELAKKGLAVNPTSAEKEYISSLMPEELKVLRNAPFALKGYAFTNPGLSRYFSTWDWYHPSEAASGALESLTPAQKRLFDYVVAEEARRKN